MKYIVLLLSILFFMNCTSELDKPENQPLMLDNTVNPNLKINVDVFLESPTNKTYLDSNCIKSNENNYFDYIYSKDSSYVEFRNGKVHVTAIKSKGQFLNYGIEIGQKRQDFEAIFLRLYDNRKKPYIALKKDKIELSCCELGVAVWTFNFENNRLKSIYFIDNSMKLEGDE